MKPVLSLYPTLLDSFYWYKKIPSPAKFQELIDKINRVKPSEFPIAAKKGIQFEDTVNKLLKGMNIQRRDGVYVAQDFEFNSVIVDKIVHKLANHKKQQEYIQAIVPTEIGNVKLYGFVDYTYPDSDVDLKTTGSYSFGKFKINNQHKCYSLIRESNGTPIKDFKYLVTDFSHVFVETYPSSKQLHEEFLQEVYGFNEFLQTNRELITDTKIFGNQF